MSQPNQHGAFNYAGTLPVANGGTGDTTFTNGQLLIGNTTGNTLTKAALTAGTNVTITNGSGAITIAAFSGAFGTDLSFEDYSLTTSSALSSAANAQTNMQSVSLDGTSELMILYGTASIHAVVFNTSTNTFGTPVLVRTAAASGVIKDAALAKISSTSVLVCSLPGNTALETVVLTISGSTITVGTAVATTLSANSGFFATNTRLVTVGSSYVLNYNNNSGGTPKFRAITVSGSTPSVGSELAYTGGGTAPALHHSYAHSSTILLSFSMTLSTTVFAMPITVSGTTLTLGTAATVSTAGPSFFITGALSNSRYAMFYQGASLTDGKGAVVSVAGSVASISTSATSVTVVSFAPTMQVFGNQAFVGNGGAGDPINVITDTAGVATLGTDLATPGSQGNIAGYLSTGKVLYVNTIAGDTTYVQYGISSGSAVLEKSFTNVTSTTVVTVRVAANATYARPLSGLPQSGSGNQVMLRTSSGKHCPGTSLLLPFAASIDGTSSAKLQQSANPFTTYNDGISEAVAWGFPTSQAASTTTVQLRKVTLA